ncbi:MAG: heavy metal translocating P-type ATPase [Terracidiphilus sp.]|jgi:Cu2+-exporting ATPase
MIQLALLLLTYVASKVYYESLKIEQKKTEEGPEQQRETKSQDIAESREIIEKRQLGHLKGSLASMGFFAVRHFVPGALPLGLVTYLYNAVPTMKNVEEALVREKKVNVDVLFFVADVLTFATKNYFTAAFGLTMIHAGRYQVIRAKDDSAKMLTHLFKELPQSVWTLVDGQEVEIPLADIRAGDFLIVTSGSVIPVDGVIQEGTAQIDQCALTGEAQPAEKGKDDPVFANTIVIAGKLLIRVDRSGADTTSAQIAAMLLNSVSFKTGVQLKGERWADQMSLPMLASSIALLPFIGPTSTAVFINSHFGARIMIFAPLTTLRHIREASLLGVLVKDGRALEQLCDVDTILFDKTGTLTTDQPEVKSVTARNGHTVQEILSYAATAERKLAHPIARAILKRARNEGVTAYEVQDSNYKIGFGVTVTVDGKLIRVGSIRFFQQEGIRIPKDVLRKQEESHASGNTFILVGIDRRIGGTLELEPQTRPKTREMIAQLRAFGINHMGIVSGDDRTPTRKLAEDLGMDEYFYNVLPENKAKIVESLQAKGKVICFVGDGINDSIALQRANVSMSIAGATSIAKDMAEIIFMDGSLDHLVPLVELSRRLEINLQRSWILCIVPGFINLLGAFVLNFNVLAALLVNNVFSTVGVSGVYYTREKVTPRFSNGSPEEICPVDATEIVP